MDPVSLAGAAGSQRRLKNQQDAQKRWEKVCEDQKNWLLTIGMAKSGFGAGLELNSAPIQETRFRLDRRRANQFFHTF